MYTKGVPGSTVDQRTPMPIGVELWVDLGEASFGSERGLAYLITYSVACHNRMSANKAHISILIKG